MTEPEVQHVIVGWFEKQGYRVTEKCELEGGNKIDVLAMSNSSEWRVEAKGDYDKNSAQYTVNFDTGMGQLLKSITRLNGLVRYGIAIPISRTERGEALSYRQILPKYAESIAFEALNIRVLLVRDDQTVEVVVPSAVCSLFRKWRA